MSEIKMSRQETLNRGSDITPQGNREHKHSSSKILKITSVAVGLTLILGGCEEVPPKITTPIISEGTMPSQEPIESLIPTATPTPTPEATPTPTPEATPSATPTPTVEATPVPTLNPKEQEDLALQEKMELAPEVEGAQKVIQEINGLKRVTYVAEAGNPYGVETGAYIGEYKKEVFIQGNETGGLAFIGKVAEYYLNKELKNIPDGEEKYRLVLPADISDLKTLSNVKIETGGEHICADNPIFIDFGDEAISVGNIILGKNKLTTTISPRSKYAFICGEDSISGNNITFDKMMNFITIVMKHKEIDKTFDKNNTVRNFSDKLGETSDKIFISFSSLEPAFENKDPSIDKILDYGNLPVFVISN